MSGNIKVGDLENTLPSWKSNHLGKRSYMTIEVTQYPSSPREDPSDNEGSPLVDTRPSPKRETNTTTQGERDRLRESCSFPFGIQIRLPEVDETIASTRPSKVAFDEAIFQASLRLPIHPMIRRILAYYNICPAQLAPNAWQISSAQWCCVNFIRAWGSKGPEVMEHPRTKYPIKDIFCSKSFLQSFDLDSGKMASSGGDNVEEKSIDDAAHIAANKAMSKKINMKKLSQMAKGRGKPKDAKKKGPMPMPPPEDKKKGSANKAPSKSKATSSQEATPAAAHREGTLANPGVALGSNASILENPKAVVLGSSNAGHNREMQEEAITLQANELRRVKEEHDADLERLQKEVAELKEREALAKMLTAKEYKPSDDFQEALEKAASTYFGEGFDLCKKQIRLLHPYLDIQDLQIDPELVEDDEEKEKYKLDNSHPPQ
ncbi:hypothetical protein Acr_29g0007220 [Actinidia rufa]|uniref:Transposase (putative) gypsy type domain-containing protein n=1 Tax=Actinidia rufa TaxID=165716 RepID=A0A7J0HEL4_9ERIC|nr:hypothetical protein Acr_29g0007220 [Actinidia rufa]